jgi:hypothetical protein
MADMLETHKRQKRGDHNFKKWVLPVLQTVFPGRWQSTSGTHLDYKYGIDWMYDSPEGIPQHFATRSWLSRPYQNHCIRYRRSDRPAMPVECQIMHQNWLENKTFPDYRIEAWIHRGYVYIAISDSQLLWQVIDQKLNSGSFSTFAVRNPRSHTDFMKIPFLDLLEPPQKIVQKLPNWD